MIFAASFAALFALSACNNQPTTPETTPPASDSTAVAVDTPITIAPDITIQFKDTQAVLTVSGETTTLIQEPMASGIAYKNDKYEYLEHQGAISIIKEGKTLFENDLAKQATAGATAVPYSEAKNYFVLNTYKDGQLKNPKLSNSKEFDTYFGPAATMGEGGRPTPIDFEKQYVVAVITPLSDKNPSLVIDGVEQNGADIVVNYRVVEGEKTTFTVRPAKALLIDKKYTGNVILQKK